MKELAMRYFKVFTLLLVLQLALPARMPAQCPMCKAAVTSGSNDGKGNDGKGSALAENLNLGILYLFVLPYASILLVTFVVYRSYRKKYRAGNLEESEGLENASGGATANPDAEPS